MSRPIDADALTKRLIEFCNKNCPYTAKERNVMCGSCFMGLALEAVEDAPTIEPQCKKGQWLTSDDMYETGVCSCCGYDTREPVSCVNYAYCPNCGAKMENELEYREAERQWIPCSERLPEESGSYFVSGKWASGKVAVGDCEYSKDDGYFQTAWNFDVEAWMPLPEPYNNKE